MKGPQHLGSLLPSLPHRSLELPRLGFIPLLHRQVAGALERKAQAFPPCSLLPFPNSELVSAIPNVWNRQTEIREGVAKRRAGWWGGEGVLLVLTLLFHSQHHWFTPIGSAQMSLHRFLSLGSPEANPPQCVCLPHLHMQTRAQRVLGGEPGGEGRAVQKARGSRRV